MQPLADIDRRTALQWLAGLAASATLEGCPTVPPAPSPIPGPLPLPPIPINVPPPDRRVDVHCHVFNVLDVPAFAFVMDVVIQNPLLRALGAPFVALVVSIAEFRAHTYADELGVLTAPRLASGALADIPKNSDQPVDQFSGGLKRYVDRYTKYSSDRGLLKAKAETEAYDKFIEQLFKQFPESISDFEGSSFDIGQQMIKAAPVLARNIMKYQSSDHTDTGSYIRQFVTDWAPKLSDYRFQLAELTQRFDEAGDDVPLLLTPATVDLLYWLPSADPSNPPTSIDDQTRLLGLISLAQPPKRVVHGFVAYDPMRQIFDEYAGRKTALAVVQDAIANKGCVGVKIYPPMGFKPINNDLIADDDFPPVLVSQFPGLGPRLDTALKKLYDYCVTEDIPIMAHCAPTQGPTPQAAARADPEFWGQLLDMAEYKTLRVNLGHIGGIWDFDHPQGSWTAKVINMMASGRYPTLYADFADFTEILGRSSTEISKRAAVVRNLIDAVHGSTAVKAHMLFGSDWHLLDREPDNAGYPRAMAALIGVAFGATEIPAFFWRNPATYMGLTTNGKTLARLRKFYRDNKSDPTVLDPFIA